MEYNCLVCGNIWINKKLPKDIIPLHCPRCKNITWEVGHNSPCQLCKKTIIIPHLHHIDRKHNNNHKDNRIFLCPRCHSHIHNHKDYFLYRKFKNKQDFINYDNTCL